MFSRTGKSEKLLQTTDRIFILINLGNWVSNPQKKAYLCIAKIDLKY
jgi:hypothetical protein